MDQKLADCSKSSAVRTNRCIKSTVNKLFESRSKTGDIKFLIDGEEIAAHRCVLAALSPKYDTQFYGSMPEEDTIILKDVSAAAFKEFLQFFYTNEVKLTLENIEDVIYLAQQSLVDDLVTECANFLLYMVGLDNLIASYRLALVYDIQPLEEFCVKYIGANIKSVFKTADFLHCERDMLDHVLAIDSLECDEVEVFDACISWAQAKCERDGIDANERANLREVLGDAFLKIRFCSMKFDEYAATKRKYSGLLTAEESIEVFNVIASKANHVKSIKFDENNNKRRQSLQRKTSMECRFAKFSHMQYDSIKDTDYIAFHCDKKIQLTGFVICNRIVDNIEISIFVDAKEKSQNLPKTLALSDTETTVIFDEPIFIPGFAWTDIRIKSKGFQQKSETSLTGYYTEKFAKQNGIMFRFLDYKSNNLNLITRFLFNPVN